MAGFDADSTIGGIGTGAQIGAAFGPIGALAGGVIGGIAGIFGSSKAKRRRRRARELQKRIQFESAMRQRFAAIRQGFANQAAVALSTSAAGITGDSSVYQGAQAGAQGSLYEALKYNAINFRANQRIAQLTLKADRDRQILQGFFSGASAFAGAFRNRVPADTTGTIPRLSGPVDPFGRTFGQGEIVLPNIKIPSQG
jgi:hypothetical protein